MSDKSKLENFSDTSRKTANRLDKIANRIFVVIVLIVLGFFFLPLGIILWVFAVLAFLSAFSD